MIKKIIFCSILCIMLALSGCCCCSGLGDNNIISDSPYQSTKTPTSDKVEYVNYNSQEMGVSFKVPSTWDKEETEYYVYVYAPLEGPEDAYGENIVIEMDNTSDAASLSEYVDLTMDVMKDNYPDLEIKSREQTSVNGYPAIKLVYSFTDGDMGMKYLDIYTMKDNSYYLFGYSATAQTYDKYLNTAEYVLNSIKFN